MTANDLWADAIKEALAHKTMLRASELTVGIFVKHPDYKCIFMVLETHLNPARLSPMGRSNSLTVSALSLNILS